ncbi:MAG: acyl-[ACP]--phospholipid O-acyltransferase [Legionella sp. 40-6]|nr:AMP-binding protein [Legionella sp.]OJY06079.1 MAG: acyl-[ACP]--phospholipid O-acyltransferase [Legionella sp. 40-6]
MDQKNWKEMLKEKAKKWIKSLLLHCFRLEVRGEYHPDTNSVIIANRTSKIDLLLLAAFLPERLTVAIHPQAAGTLWMSVMGMFADLIEVDSTRAQAARALIKAIKSGKRCVIFPQGISLQEESLRVYDGPALVLQKAGASVIPVRIDGPQHSIFSISKDKHRTRLFPKVILNILPTQRFTTDVKESAARARVSLRLFRLISELSFANSFRPQPLFQALLEGAYLGSKHQCKIEDTNRTPLSYRQFIARCFILGRQIKDQTQAGEYVGVMMPTTIAGMVTFFALHAYRRLPAMLNFSMGFYNLFSACHTAGIKTIYTSKQFIATAKLETLIDELKDAGLTIRYLEDFKEHISLGNKLAGLLKGTFPLLAYKLLGSPVNAAQPAVILFTSGSEGVPKGVALSHANILANCWQLTSRVDFSSRDIFFNSLPIFHCFGLTAGSILPLMVGVNCFFYPSPLHYKIIPGLVYQTGATIMFGTDTFLTGYARAAERHDFNTVRYIFAGAEKVKPETIRHWSDNFGVKIYEGYGATETAPVISTNCPLAFIPGSVGMLLPMIESKITPVEGIAHGGRLHLRGPNVMLGYLSQEARGIINAPQDGWHDTGDIVTVDDEGFIHIAGRAKRFAKIAGEMVSLTAVEGIAASIWPEVLHAAIARKSVKKGEEIILFSEAANAERGPFIKKVQEQGYSELLIPQQIYGNSKVPILSSGKIDYVTLEQQLQESTEMLHDLKGKAT